MKRLVVYGLVAVLVLFAGAAVFAGSGDEGNGRWNYMVDFCSRAMSSPEQHALMHDASSPEFQQMLDACHGAGGTGPASMMQSF